MKNNKEVPSNYPHPGCAFAEKGYWDDFDNPLKPLKIVPPELEKQVLLEERVVIQGCDGDYVEKKIKLHPRYSPKPSLLREEPLVTLKVSSSGIHPITLIKPEVMRYAWLILSADVVEEIRKFPYMYQRNTIAYGEFFRLENYDTFVLQKVEFFEGWRILRECQINGTIIQRPEKPELIIEMVMDEE